MRRQSVAPTPLWEERSDAGGCLRAIERQDRRAPRAHAKAAWRYRFPPHSIGWRHVHAAFLLIRFDSLLIIPSADGWKPSLLACAGRSPITHP